jgi:hypothetical protein
MNRAEPAKAGLRNRNMKVSSFTTGQVSNPQEELAPTAPLLNNVCERLSAKSVRKDDSDCGFRSVFDFLRCCHISVPFSEAGRKKNRGSADPVNPFEYLPLELISAIMHRVPPSDRIVLKSISRQTHACFAAMTPVERGVAEAARVLVDIQKLKRRFPKKFSVGLMHRAFSRVSEMPEDSQRKALFELVSWTMAVKKSADRHLVIRSIVNVAMKSPGTRWPVEVMRQFVAQLQDGDVALMQEFIGNALNLSPDAGEDNYLRWNLLGWIADKIGNVDDKEHALAWLTLYRQLPMGPADAPPEMGMLVHGLWYSWLNVCSHKLFPSDQKPEIRHRMSHHGSIYYLPRDEVRDITIQWHIDRRRAVEKAKIKEEFWRGLTDNSNYRSDSSGGAGCGGG